MNWEEWDECTWVITLVSRKVFSNPENSAITLKKASGVGQTAREGSTKHTAGLAHPHARSQHRIKLGLSEVNPRDKMCWCASYRQEKKVFKEGCTPENRKKKAQMCKQNPCFLKLCRTWWGAMFATQKRVEISSSNVKQGAWSVTLNSTRD